MLGEGARALATRQHRTSFGDQADAARHLAFGLGLRYCLAANVGKPDGSGWSWDAGREGQLGSDSYLSPGRRAVERPPFPSGTRARRQQIQHNHEDHRQDADVVGIDFRCHFEHLERHHDEYGPRRESGQFGTARQTIGNPG